MRQQQETASIRITRDEGKRDLAREPTRRDGSETGCPVVLFFPKGALTHHLPAGQVVVSLLVVGPCALRGGTGLALSAESAGRCGRCSSRPRRAAFPSLRDQPAGWSWQYVFPLEMQPSWLPNLPPAGLTKELAVGVHSASFYGRRYGLPQLLWSLAMMNMKEE